MNASRRAKVSAVLAAKRAEVEAQIGSIEDAVTHSTAGGISFGKRVGDGRASRWSGSARSLPTRACTTR